MFITVRGLFITVRGLFITVRGLFITVRGLFITVRGLFITVRGLFITVRGLFITVRGLFITVRGLFITVRGLFITVRGLFITVRGLFITVRGLFITVRGLFITVRGLFITVCCAFFFFKRFLLLESCEGSSSRLNRHTYHSNNTDSISLGRSPKEFQSRSSQNKIDRIQVLDKRLVQKVCDILHQPVFRQLHKRAATRLERRSRTAQSNSTGGSDALCF